MLVNPFDHRGGAYRFTAQQNIFNFNRRDPLPGRLEEIITAPHVPPETIRIASVKIPCAHPAIHERFRSGLRPLPVTWGRAAAPNPEVARLAAGRRHALMINHACFITTQQLSAAAIAYIARVVRHEHVQHLSRADSVQNFDAKSSLPVLSQLRRQGLTRRYAQAQTRRVQFVPGAFAMMFEEHSVDNGYAKKDRRTIVFENPSDNIRRGFLAAKNRSESIEQRKSKTVSQAVSEGQARRRKQPVAFAQLQDFAAESFVGIEDVRLPVHRALRFTRAA